MKLITKEIEKQLARYPLYSQESAGKDAKVLVKFFCGRWTWYVTEAQKQANGKYLFFGYVDGEFPEMGYFTQDDIETARVRVEVRGLGTFEIPAERDLYFRPCKLFDVMSEHCY